MEIWSTHAALTYCFPLLFAISPAGCGCSRRSWWPEEGGRDTQRWTCCRGFPPSAGGSCHGLCTAWSLMGGRWWRCERWTSVGEYRDPLISYHKWFLRHHFKVMTHFPRVKEVYLPVSKRYKELLVTKGQLLTTVVHVHINANRTAFI